MTQLAHLTPQFSACVVDNTFHRHLVRTVLNQRTSSFEQQKNRKINKPLSTRSQVFWKWEIYFCGLPRHPNVPGEVFIKNEGFWKLCGFLWIRIWMRTDVTGDLHILGLSINQSLIISRSLCVQLQHELHLYPCSTNSFHVASVIFLPPHKQTYEHMRCALTAAHSVFMCHQRKVA